MTASSESAGHINLFRGWPNPALLPVPALATASASLMATPSRRTPALLYGPDEGDALLRQHISHWLTEFYDPQFPVDPGRICITGGASQNLACILQVFTDPVYTRNIWMLAPTYFLACRMMDDAGFAGRMRAVPPHPHGLDLDVDLDFLRRGLLDAEEKANRENNSHPNLKPPRPWAKIYKHVIYATPTFSNPTMQTMPLSTRQQLIRLAREFDALVVSDDVYDFLQWSADPAVPLPRGDRATVPRLVDVDRELDGGPQDAFGNAVSNGSFSKILGPGMRTGWAEGTPQFAYGLSQTGSSRSGGAPSQFSAVIVSELFTNRSIQTYLEEVLRPAYAERYHRMMAAVRAHLLPLGVRVPLSTPSSSSTAVGGYFIWIVLPEGLRASQIAPLALEKYGVNVAEGNLFRVKGDPAEENNDFDRGMRLCFAWEDVEGLEEGVRRLARAVESVR